MSLSPASAREAQARPHSHSSGQTQGHTHDHAHNHGHAHDHAHDHAHNHGHDHHHAHDHRPAGEAGRGPAPAPERALSLLRMSAAQRLAGACALSALVWAGVIWALQ